MIPARAWSYITARVRNEFHDTIFMLEGLGGSLSITEDLLSSSTLNWAYSELFQNYTKDQIVGYLDYCDHISETQGTMVHFAETHDNNRLAAASKQYAKMRTAMCALFSSAGAFGITNGVEWFASEKVDVHEASGLNWGSEDNQVDDIRRINILLKNHPSFQAGAKQRFIHIGGNETMALLREPAKESIRRSELLKHTPDGKILVVVNLDTENSASLSWSLDDFAPEKDSVFFDLLSGEQVQCELSDNQMHCLLPGGKVFALVKDRLYFDILLEWEKVEGFTLPPAVYARRINTIMQKAIVNIKGLTEMKEYDLDALSKIFKKDPEEFFAQICDYDNYVPTVWWNYETDRKREVMLLPKHFLIITAKDHFLTELTDLDGNVIERSSSIRLEAGRHLAVLDSFDIACNSNMAYKLRMKVYKPGASETFDAALMVPAENDGQISIDVNRKKLLRNDDHALCRNELGGYGQLRAKWAQIKSKYDAFIAANLNPRYPVDRHIMLTRLRAWVVYRDYSTEVSVDYQQSFTTDMQNKVTWRFDLPVGMGKRIPFAITYVLSQKDNSAQIAFSRLDNDGRDCLEDDQLVKLIIRPDIEDRNSHGVTKAYQGPEFGFPGAVELSQGGFLFKPADSRQLKMTASDDGTFNIEPEWNYMIGLPVEKQRGLESSTDLFSPGYFKFKLCAGCTAVLNTSVSSLKFESKIKESDVSPVPLSKIWNTKELLKRGMGFYMVKRGDFKTVIAGYPWFLDWGRDTFIALRGFIRGGFLEEAGEIIKQFASFEENGTLPNMIRGDDVSNRDTTDAPLWLFTAIKDIIEKSGSEFLLSDDCGGRTLLDVLISIANGYINGTPNGIKVDPETMLVFSPPHFTWMDTNYPAATPREGYPIEIQALWFAALNLLDKYDTGNRYKWQSMANQVRQSVLRLYVNESGDLADCLLCRSGISANLAQKDDALRPNQLFAVTLGLVDDKQTATAILDNCSQLLIPGSIRSLADKKLTCELPVYNNGRLLNDPVNPYFGTYGGDEDSSRKPAYHNGTAWGWVFPSYCEAMLKVYGDPVRPLARSLMLSINKLLKNGCIGHLPEICDGDYPHTQRGCKAQAWSVTEAYRILDMLE
jgi:predicted glycogen debranching enzyme